MEAQEIITAEAGTVALLNKSEIDMQVATAHKYPRSVKRFRDETLAMSRPSRARGLKPCQRY